MKRYLGPDREERLNREVRALQALAGRFPVPPLLEYDSSRIVVGYLAGVPGQELLEQKPVPVLHEVGRAARRLHAMDLGESYGPRKVSVLVHGDFGPQNMLFAATGQLAALVDWEFAHLGDPIEDLAWPSGSCVPTTRIWRTRWRRCSRVRELPVVVAAALGHAAKCAELQAFSLRWSSEAAGVWQQRIEATEAFGD